ncbi:MAG: hypothetical protein FWC91_03460 [Defluviitaleaceae bacterium]|nr:hypothetical protein [Defluviitaleaceae bacterium]
MDRKTIRKYWDMEEGEYAGVVIESKRRTRGLDEYRNFIVGRLNEYPEITSAITEDHLRKDVLKAFETLDGAKEYIDRIIVKYPRYVRDQLIIIRNTQKSYEMAELQKAIDYCLERELISANDFRDTLAYFRAAEAPIEPRKVSLPTKYSLIVAQARPVNAYIQAFDGNKRGGIYHESRNYFPCKAIPSKFPIRWYYLS